jgi:hypothetical protein
MTSDYLSYGIPPIRSQSVENTTKVLALRLRPDERVHCGIVARLLSIMGCGMVGSHHRWGRVIPRRSIVIWIGILPRAGRF